ncbi:hypothetical protein C8F04DRAFT_1247536 [Mycena alexandri]|uniref:Uncharacterized protein n=1 Tax=Mycena alexandri TaxID=1745969 RepID=A0AAD6XD26_9AGAR|nr:hypothetical protein C8F04DRAFT_1247536 [Mycena alexandri]
MNELNPATIELQSFVQRTNVESMRPEIYEYDRFARSLGLEFSPTERPERLGSAPERSSLDHSRSSLRWQLGISENEELPAHRGLPMGEEQILPSTGAPAIRLPPPGRDESYVPPPIAPPAKSKGNWEVYAEEVAEEGEPGYDNVDSVMILRGKNKKNKADLEEEQELWWDREKKRKLIFSDLPPPPEGATEDDEFGRPVPAWNFGIRGNKWIKVKESVWMYRREKPDPQRVGETYQPPPPPLAIDSPLPPARDEDVEMPAFDGNTNAALEKDEDTVSLGPGSDEEGALRREDSSPPVQSDVIMGNTEAHDPIVLDQASEGPVTAPALEIPDVVMSEPPRAEQERVSRYLRILGLPLGWSATRFEDWMGKDAFGKVLTLRRIVVRGIAVDFVLALRDEETAAQIKLLAANDPRVRRGARFLERTEFDQTIVGSAEQLRLPPPRPAPSQETRTREEQRGRNQVRPVPRGPMAGRYENRSPERRERGVKRHRSRSGSRERDFRPRWTSPRRERSPARRPTSPPRALRTYGLLPPLAPEPMVGKIAQPSRSTASASSSTFPPNVSFRPPDSARTTDREVGYPSRSTARTQNLAPPRALPRAITRNAPKPNLPAAPPPPALYRAPIQQADAEPSLLRRISEAPMTESSSLLMRMGDSASMEEKSLLQRTGVRLEERISTVTKTPRRRKHDRTKHRINKLVDVELELATSLTEPFPWTDEEIDFFIDHEEGPPLPDDEYLPHGDFYDTDEE